MAVTYVCETCGSDDVSRDAWADWDVTSQNWVLRVAFDYAQCHCCDVKTSLRQIETMAPEELTLSA